MEFDLQSNNNELKKDKFSLVLVLKIITVFLLFGSLCGIIAFGLYTGCENAYLYSDDKYLMTVKRNISIYLTGYIFIVGFIFFIEYLFYRKNKNLTIVSTKKFLLVGIIKILTVSFFLFFICSIVSFLYAINNCEGGHYDGHGHYLCSTYSGDYVGYNFSLKALMLVTFVSTIRFLIILIFPYYCIRLILNNRSKFNFIHIIDSYFKYISIILFLAVIIFYSLIYFERSNNGKYHHLTINEKSKKVFDISTLECLSHDHVGFSGGQCRIARDSKNLYDCKSGNIINLDIDTFKSFNNFDTWSLDSYYLDKNNVYYNRNIIKDANVNTFKYINIFNAKDKNNVYYKGKTINNADPSTFTMLNYYDNDYYDYCYGYAKDKNNVYYEGKMISSVDSDTFVRLGDYFSKDKNNVYDRNNNIIQGADLKTFNVDSGKAEDKNFYYSYTRDDGEYKLLKRPKKSR